MASHKELRNRLQALMNKPENQACCECSESKPNYAALLAPPPGSTQAIGAFCCYKCSVAHKTLGSKTCIVLSIGLDEWSEKEVSIMEQGGIKKVNSIFEGKISFDIPRPKVTSDKTFREAFVHQKYKELLYFNPSALKAKGAISLTLKAPSSDTRTTRANTTATPTATFSSSVDEQEQQRHQMGYDDDPAAAAPAPAAPPRRRQGRRSSIGTPVSMRSTDDAPQAPKSMKNINSRMRSTDDAPPPQAPKSMKNLGSRMRSSEDAPPPQAPKSMKNLGSRMRSSEDAPPQAPKSMKNINSRARSSEDAPPQAPKSMKNIKSRMKSADDFPQPPKSMKNINERSSFDTFDTDEDFGGDNGAWDTFDGGDNNTPNEYVTALAAPADNNKPKSRSRKDGLSRSSHGDSSQDKRLVGRRASLSVSSHSSQSLPAGSSGRRRKDSLGASNHSTTDADSLGYGYGDDDDQPPPQPRSMRRTGRRSSLGMATGPSRNTPDSGDDEEPAPKSVASRRLAARRGSIGVPVPTTTPTPTQDVSDDVSVMSSGTTMSSGSGTGTHISSRRSRKDPLGPSNHSTDDPFDQGDRQRLGYGDANADEEPAEAPPRSRRTSRRSSIGVRETPSQPSHQIQQVDDPSSGGATRRPRSGRRASMAGSGPTPADKTSSKRGQRGGAALPESLQGVQTNKGGSDGTVATVSCDDSSDSATDEKAAAKPKSSAKLLSSLYGAGEGASAAKPEASTSVRRRTARRSSCV